MIKAYGSTQTMTPKKKAAEIVDDFMDQMLDSWSEASGSQYKDMTEEEVSKVKEQLENYTQRIQKMLGRNFK